MRRAPWLPAIAGLRLDALREEDYPCFSALYADPAVAIPTGLAPLTEPAAARAWFDQARNLPPPRGRILALRQAGAPELIGSLRLTDWDQHAQNVTLGYALAPAFWGRGLMGACLAGLLPWVFAGGLGAPLHRLQAWVMASNPRSARLLQSAGFSHEGTLRGLFRNDSGHHDILGFSLLRSDPAAPGAAPGRLR